MLVVPTSARCGRLLAYIPVGLPHGTFYLLLLGTGSLWYGYLLMHIAVFQSQLALQQ